MVRGIQSEYVCLFTNPIGFTGAEVASMRLYLRNTGGAGIPLSREATVFRTELPKWTPIAATGNKTTVPFQGGSLLNLIANSHHELNSLNKKAQ